MIGNGEHLHSYTNFGTTDVMASGSCRWATGQFCSPADPVMVSARRWLCSQEPSLWCLQNSKSHYWLWTRMLSFNRDLYYVLLGKNTLSPVLCEDNYSRTHRIKRNYLKGRPHGRDRIIHQLGLCTGLGASTSEKYGILVWVQRGVTVKS